jgi:hypothetical protein
MITTVRSSPELSNSMAIRALPRWPA